MFSGPITGTAKFQGIPLILLITWTVVFLNYFTSLCPVYVERNRQGIPQDYNEVAVCGVRHKHGCLPSTPEITGRVNGPMALDLAEDKGIPKLLSPHLPIQEVSRVFQKLVWYASRELKQFFDWSWRKSASLWISSYLRQVCYGWNWGLSTEWIYRWNIFLSSLLTTSN